MEGREGVGKQNRGETEKRVNDKKKKHGRGRKGVSEGEHRKWEIAGSRKGGGEEDKNDPIDRLYPGSRIDVHLSPASVISPTNHDVTSTGQYRTLQASSSRAGLPPSARTAQRGHCSYLN